MSEEKGTCYFCDSVHTTAKSTGCCLRINVKYIFECTECNRSFCYLIHASITEDIKCGTRRNYAKNYWICKICKIIKSDNIEKYIKVNNKTLEALTGSNTKSSNKN